jgi:hypothetical protein
MINDKSIFRAISLSLAILGLSQSAAWTQTPDIPRNETFPYVGRVTAASVEIRSAPDMSAYPTMRLPQGTTVEVYRHDADDWCAIRPPEGSFSWVDGYAVQRREDGLGVVLEDLTPARVGVWSAPRSDGSPSRSPMADGIAHILLHKGQIVRILEETTDGTSYDSVVYKVSPPAGEFRWVPRQAIERMHAMPNATPPSRDTTSESSPVSSTPTLVPVVSSETVNEQLDDVEPVFFEPDQSLGGNTATPPSPLRPVSGTGFDAELSSKRRELILLTAQIASGDQFNDLLTRTGRLISTVANGEERLRLQTLLDDIEEIRNVQWRRHAESRHAEEGRSVIAPTGSDPSSMPPNSWTPAGSEGAQANHQESLPESVRTIDISDYDAYGFLIRRDDAKPGEPPFVLQSPETGEPTCYVSAAPGVNLEFHVRRLVGVDGVRTYTSAGIRHLQVKQATLLYDPLSNGSN